MASDEDTALTYCGPDEKPSPQRSRDCNILFDFITFISEEKNFKNFNRNTWKSGISQSTNNFLFDTFIQEKQFPPTIFI